MKKRTKQKNRKGCSVQQLIGIRSFTRDGIRVGKDELIYYMIAPTNISVLSAANIEGKIRHLMMVLCAIPNIEVSCTDASECFDNNKLYLRDRLKKERNTHIRELIQKDMDFLDSVQSDISTARQFMLVMRRRIGKENQPEVSDVERTIRDEEFEYKRLRKEDIKRILAIYFDASLYGEQMPDVDGAQYLEVVHNEA